MAKKKDTNTDNKNTETRVTETHITETVVTEVSDDVEGTGVTDKPETTTTPAEKPAEETPSAGSKPGGGGSADLTTALTTVLIRLIEQEIENNNANIKQLLLQRLAANNISYTRTPAPLNITEIGGYYNLLSDAFGDDKSMSRQMLAAILGLPYIGN